MERKELYKKIEGKLASLVFGNLEVEMATAIADGKNTHSRGDLETYFCSHANLYRIAEYPEETIAQLKKRDKEVFEKSMNKILEAVNNYGIKI